MADQVELRTGAYYDSVSLMQVSRSVAAAPGVEAAQVAMATELNLDVIRGMGFDLPEAGAQRPGRSRSAGTSPASPRAGQRSTTRSPGCVRRPPQSGGFGEAPPPRTLGGAVRRADANLALVAVPGQHATTEALDAINAGVSVMIFSDNVPVEDEVRLKDLAADRGVLVMGPDCGTAVVGGVGLGFANVVRPGSVGVVAASGTGAQQVMCLLDAAGDGRQPRASASAAATCPPRSPAAPPSRPSPRSPPTPPPRASSSSPSLLPLRCCPTSSRMPLGSASRSTGPRSGPGSQTSPRQSSPLLATRAARIEWPHWEAGATGGDAGRRCGASSAGARSPTRRCSWRGRPSATSGPTPRSGRTWPSVPTCATPATSSSTSATTR